MLDKIFVIFLQKILIMISSSIKEILPKVQAFFSTQPVIYRAWIFGSCAKGTETDLSDVDLLVDYDRKNYRISLFTLGGIIRKLELIFNRNIDLVENGFLIPEAQASANSEKIVIYERKKFVTHKGSSIF